MNSRREGRDTRHSLNTATARALAEKALLSIEATTTSTAFQLGIVPPAPETRQTHTGKTLARGYSDGVALVARYHNENIHSRLAPRSQLARALFNEMELARCEAIGAARYAGVEANLAALRQRSHAATNSRSDTIAQLLAVLGNLTREVLGIKVCQLDALKTQVAHWRDASLHNHSDLWRKLPAAVPEQTAFALLTLQLIDTIDVSTINDPEPELTDSIVTETDADNDDDDQTSSNDNQTDETPADKNEPDNSLLVEHRDDPEQPGEAQESDTAIADSDEVTLLNRDAPVNIDSDTTASSAQTCGRGYSAYSTAHDEIVAAGSLCTGEELDSLRKTLDTQIEQHKKIIGKLSGRLQRVLMTQQQRHWIFDLEEGQLDTTRLTQIITDPLSALSFKQESDIAFKSTTVTLLIDNSKSMLGKPIAIAAACADLLTQTLERCGVCVEILGFTTTHLHGGALLEQWQNSGAHPDPGRLNGLRHIIYKSADRPYRRTRKEFGLMLKKDLLNQNIDGEALLWANERILRRPEQRKILMVISDGAPIDTGTLSANPPDYLAGHLHEVIATIERRGTVELVAIGIGHDVSQYYQRAMTIYDTKDLGKSMLAHLSALFSSTSSRTQSTR
ncbi:hypothetical protein AB833_18935 [Chromatiales bacterium (ex Bugula neritina AB1)]|nr:hypothetical protein AB833_18935 [Chromatiales bacterium (ex Bugula neritina AB1)]